MISCFPFLKRVTQIFVDVYVLQSHKAQSLPQNDLFYLKEKADPDRAQNPHHWLSQCCYAGMVKMLKQSNVLIAPLSHGVYGLIIGSAY